MLKTKTLNTNVPVISLIFGEAGKGKTTLATTAGKSIIFDFDNEGFIRSYRPSDSQAVEFSTHEDILQITKDDLAEVDTVVIDTLGGLVQQEMAWMPSSMKQTNGALKLQAWGEMANRVKIIINHFKNMGKNIVFTAHEEANRQNGSDVTRFEPKVDGNKVLADIMSQCHIVARLFQNNEGITVLNTNRTNEATTKGDIGVFTLDVEDDSSFQKIMDAYKGKLQANYDRANQAKIMIDEYASEMSQMEPEEAMAYLGEAKQKLTKLQLAKLFNDYKVFKKDEFEYDNETKKFIPLAKPVKS